MIGWVGITFYFCSWSTHRHWCSIDRLTDMKVHFDTQQLFCEWQSKSWIIYIRMFICSKIGIIHSKLLTDIATFVICFNLYQYMNNQLHPVIDVIMGAMASQITSLTIVYSTVFSAAGKKKHQSSASLAFVRGIHRWPVNSPHKWPITRKMFPFDDVMICNQSKLE